MQGSKLVNQPLQRDLGVQILTIYQRGLVLLLRVIGSRAWTPLGTDLELNRADPSVDPRTPIKL